MYLVNVIRAYKLVKLNYEHNLKVYDLPETKHTVCSIRIDMVKQENVVYLTFAHLPLSLSLGVLWCGNMRDLRYNFLASARIWDARKLLGCISDNLGATQPVFCSRRQDWLICLYCIIFLIIVCSLLQMVRAFVSKPQFLKTYLTTESKLGHTVKYFYAETTNQLLQTAIDPL